MSLSPAVRADARANDLLRLLRALSRTGATVCVGGRGAVVTVERHGTRVETAVGAEIWDEARRMAWIDRDGGGTTWRVTAQGRSMLRRWLSQSPSVASAASGPPRSPDKPRLNDAECPLSWLSRRKDRSGAPLISDTQHRAGQRLGADFTHAQMLPRVTASWSPVAGGSDRRLAPGTGVELCDSVVAAQERVRRALSAVGPELSGILIDVCCHQKGLEDLERAAGWPQRTARIVLLIALDRLARHYGLDRAAGRDARAPVRHWGAEGYRPEITPDDV